MVNQNIRIRDIWIKSKLEERIGSHNIRGGKIWTGEWGGYLPDRGEVVKAFRFDDRGGRCLIVHKNEDKTFEVRDIRCDSPE